MADRLNHHHPQQLPPHLGNGNIPLIGQTPPKVYLFTPQVDITALEIASIMAVTMGFAVPQQGYDALCRSEIIVINPETQEQTHIPLSRHFTEESEFQRRQMEMQRQMQAMDQKLQIHPPASPDSPFSDLPPTD